MIGQTISHYKILEKLGEGGMGIVYKAEDTKLKRLVALKFLPQHLTDDSESKQRFIKEAQAAAALDHPNIATVYEIQETEDGQTPREWAMLFIAIAYVDGVTLKQKIKSGPLSIEEALACAIQIADGLKAAHENGIIHRDIKSANIMLTPKNRVKITDFGLAKIKGEATNTKSGSQMGTAPYMSPEHIQGEDVDHRSDIFSLGIVLYEMLTGQLPFSYENEAATIYAILYKSPQPPTEIRDDIPGELERIIFRCLRKEPKDRYQSAQRLLSDLTKLNKILLREFSDRKIKKVPQKDAERRQTTVLFAKISGYDELQQKMELEEFARTMSHCSDFIAAIAQKHEGTIEKLTGSHLQILFGVPAAIEDAPKKAINTAIELRNKLSQFNQRENLITPLDIHIGINTGMVITSTLGTDEAQQYSVIGDTVNLTSQMMELSEKGQICVGSLTYKYTRNEFEYKRLKLITLKGKKEPVRVYELISKREKIYRAELGTERMIYSEMVGREQELDWLQLHLVKLINGQGSIISVIGEAGIGKSRLIAEFRRKDEINRVTLLEGRALSIGQNLSFHPFIDIFKHWSGIKEEDSENESLKKLEKAIRSIDLESAEEIFPFIATLMGMKLTGKYAERVKGIEGEALERLILKNLRELIIKATGQKPLVLIMEDLHWADLSSVELLESLFRLAGANPIFFINVFRPNYQETSGRILGTIKDRYSSIHAEIVLGSLNEQQSELLVTNLLHVKGIPSKIKTLITKRAEGNPFFIEEVVRSFIDEGVVEIKNGRFRITEKIDSVVIPESINEILMTRIDKLDDETRSLVKVASVIGRNFFYKILTEVTKSIEDIDERLEYLKGIQLILERRRMAEIEYLFKHALVQQAAYESILINQRKLLHLKVAQAIETVFKEKLQEFFGTLALHYSLGEDLDQAENYLIHAGEKSLSSSASSEALHYYQEALNMYLRKCGDTADPEKIAMLEKNIAVAFFNKGQNEEAIEYFNRTLAYYGVKVPKHLIALILKSSIGFLNFVIRLQFQFLMGKKIPTQKEMEIIDLIIKKFSALGVTNPKGMFSEWVVSSRWFTKFDLTKLEYGSGEFAFASCFFSHAGISFKLSKKILEFSKGKINKNDVKSLIQYDLSAGLHNLLSGDWVEDYYDNNLVNQGLSIGEVYNTSTLHVFHGQISLERGSPDAQWIVDKLSEIADVYDNDYAKEISFRLKTLFLMKYRKLHDALNESEAGIDFMRKTGNRPILLIVYSLKIRIQMLLRDLNGAKDTLRNAEKLISENTFVPFFFVSYLTGRFIFDLYQLEEAIRNGRKSELTKKRKYTFKTGKKAVKVSRKASYDRVEIYRMMGIYYWLINKQKKALKWWQKSIQEGKRMGARLELSRTYLEVGKRLLESQSKYNSLDGINAEAYLEKARVVFEELDLHWEIEELEKINIGIER